MATDEIRLWEALRELIPAAREDAGPAPTPDELIAYREGRLDDEARRRLERKLAAYPDAVRALADLASFPNVEPAPGATRPSQVALAAAWHRFQESVASDERPALPSPDKPPSIPRIQHHRWLPIAAFIAIAFGLGYLLALIADPRSASEPIAGVPILQLAPKDAVVTRGVHGAARLGGEALQRGAMLVLLAPEGAGDLTFRVELLDAQRRRLWSYPEVRPEPEGIVNIYLPPGYLKPGSYQLRITPDSPAAGLPVLYPLEVGVR